MCNEGFIHTVEHYIGLYSGVVLAEYLDFKVTADVLAAVGGHAFGSLINSTLRDSPVEAEPAILYENESKS